MGPVTSIANRSITRERGNSAPAPRNVVKSKEKVDQKKVEKLYQKIRASGFYDLEGRYFDPEVDEGSSRTVVVKAHGKTKKVTETNRKMAAMSKVRQAMKALVELEDGQGK